MDLQNKTFGRGPKEIGGAIDLVSQYKLWPHLEWFCKRSLPLSIADSKYLQNVVGDTEIRKGEGMEIDQLCQNSSYVRGRSACIRPFDLDILWEAFRMNETTPIDLPPAEKGIPTAVVQSTSEPIEKKRKHKRHKHKIKEKGKDHTKQKKHRKDGNKDKDKDRSGLDSGLDHLKQQDKKRRHDGSEECSDTRRNKSSRNVVKLRWAS